MNNPIATLFLDIIDHLNVQVPDIKYIDFDIGQLEAPTRPSLAFPAVLFSLADATYTTHGRNTQKAELLINVRVISSPFSASSSITPLPTREKALEIFELEQKVYLALQNLKTTYCGNLNRVKSYQEFGDDTLRIRTLVFSATIFDESASVLLTKSNVEVGLEIER